MNNFHLCQMLSRCFFCVCWADVFSCMHSRNLVEDWSQHTHRIRLCTRAKSHLLHAKSCIIMHSRNQVEERSQHTRRIRLCTRAKSHLLHACALWLTCAKLCRNEEERGLWRVTEDSCIRLPFHLDTSILLFEVYFLCWSKHIIYKKADAFLSKSNSIRKKEAPNNTSISFL